MPKSHQFEKNLDLNIRLRYNVCVRKSIWMVKNVREAYKEQRI